MVILPLEMVLSLNILEVLRDESFVALSELTLIELFFMKLLPGPVFQSCG